jgi:hypothetical protein
MSQTATITTAPQIGDIFVSTWGYDQTNVDFYKVISTTAKTVTVVPIGQKIVEQTGFLSETVEPVDQIKEETTYNWETGEKTTTPAKPIRRKIISGGYIKITDYQWAKQWTGRPVNQTHYH